MRDILDEIVAYKLKEVEKYKKELSQVFLESRVEIIRKSEVVSMSLAIKSSNTGIIAEFKRKSPSKGWIAKDASPESTAYSYQTNGATALSILTDSEYFGGSNTHIRLARQQKVYLPILYKNFIVDEYQIYQAKICGASAVLLIAACLTKEQCRALLEMHSEEDTEYAELEPDMCGINNRNLGTFETDVNNSFNLIERLPADAVKVSESGISDVDTIRRLKEVGYHGFLIGETFMKEPDPGLALQQFIAQLS